MPASADVLVLEDVEPAAERPVAPEVVEIALGVVALVTLASQGQAQRRERNDSEPKFSLFGGIAADGVNTGRDAGASNFELGGSADFRLRSFPLPLRASLTFSQQHRDFYLNDRRSGALSIDAVGHPIPSFFGISTYGWLY